MKNILAVGLLFALASVNMFGQAAPVVGVADPTSLFTDKDPVLQQEQAGRDAYRHRPAGVRPLERSR